MGDPQTSGILFGTGFDEHPHAIHLGDFVADRPWVKKGQDDVRCKGSPFGCGSKLNWGYADFVFVLYAKVPF